MINNSFIESGKFILGCNYWASHAGTSMWSDWQPDIVDNDLRILAEQGVKVLRVFPMWPDFQPIEQLYQVLNRTADIRHGEKVLADDEHGRAGISLKAYSYFDEFTNIADKYGITLVVGLVTGWMSGRLFVPPALQGKNLLTDPIAIKWQVRFVKHFVKYFKDKKAIVAWGLGNECNCMSPVPDKDAAWLWTSSISNAIKTEDSKRPVVSDMHGLVLDNKWNWLMEDQAELTDILTTHPYPIFTKHAKLDPVNTMRTILHATSQTVFYRDVSGKPCFVEEQGSLGPVFSDDDVDADFMRNNLFSLYAHDCQGMMWWCNHDQYHLEQAPYDWIAMETELGLFRTDNTPKPVVKEIAAFEKVLQKLPFENLPTRIVDGVCILSQDQDHWGVAYSSFILAKQAGIDIEFQSSEQPLKEASVYMLPCISGSKVISKHRWLKLLERVQEGATLYISYNDGFLVNFEKTTGLRIHTRSERRGVDTIDFNSIGEALQLEGPTNLVLNPSGATILAKESNGNPVFSCSNYGKGKVYFLSYPLETYMTKSPGTFHDEDAAPYWKIYKEIFSDNSSDRVVKKESPLVGVTEHVVNENERIVIIINYATSSVEESISLSKGWLISETLHGTQPSIKENHSVVSINKNDAVILKLSK